MPFWALPMAPGGWAFRSMIPRNFITSAAISVGNGVICNGLFQKERPPLALDQSTARELWHRAFAHMQASEEASLDWARSINADTFKNLKSKGFLRQYCFVVYASGFRFQTVKDKFDDLSEAFCGFDIQKLSRMRSTQRVLKIFGNERKATGFLEGAKLIAREGFPAFKKRLSSRGSDMLMELPGIGPITKDHLAKNIGLADVAKADVWLVRAAKLCGTKDVGELIDFLHHETGETRHVIDVAIWTLGRDGKLALDAPAASILNARGPK